MSKLSGIDEWLQRRLPELVAEHGVGAAVAVSAGVRSSSTPRVC
ncbi:hypothetical protein ACFQY4_28365 [Catellatospora bangladeshensis]